MSLNRGRHNAVNRRALVAKSFMRPRHDSGETKTALTSSLETQTSGRMRREKVAH